MIIVPNFQNNPRLPWYYPFGVWYGTGGLDQYPLFNQVWNPDTVEAIFAGTAYPTYVQDRVYEQFYDRRICDNDIGKFVRFMNRNLKYKEHQFLEYLRVETTDFDPMVTNYVERWVQSSLNGTRVSDSTSDLSQTTETSTSGKGTDSSITETDSTSTTNIDRSTTDTTVSSTDETMSKSTDTSDVTKQTTTGEVHGETDTATTVKTLQADLPQTSAYGDAGMPPNLNFSYASSQSQTDTSQESVEDTTSSTEQDTNRSVETGEQGTTNTSVDSTSTGKNTGTDSTTGTSTATSNGTSTTEGESTTTVTGGNTGNTTDTSQTQGDTKERATGRGGAPQDLLNSARNYILKTNSILWLLDQLEICFMGIYD